MIIDTDNYAASGIETMAFPGGEHHCKVPKIPSRVVHIFAKIRSPFDMATLQVVCDVLNRNRHEIYLFIPYMPGARQDRVTSPGSPITVGIYASMFEDIVDHVTVVDIHSEDALKVMQERIGKSKVTTISSAHMIPDLIRKSNRPFPDVIIAPDTGAIERAQQAASAFGMSQHIDVLACTKERDSATGLLSKFKVPASTLYTDEMRYLIVDDICDGGGTFVGLLEEFRKRRPKAPVDLWVTHGIFSKGLGPLSGFDNVYTTDSFRQQHPHGNVYEGEFIHTLSLLPYYLEGLTP